jgi:hypothetical protein
MLFLTTHLIPTTLKQTHHGWLPVSPTPKKVRSDHTAPSLLVRAKVFDWKVDFPPEWHQELPKWYPLNVTIHNRDWSSALEDVGLEIEKESEFKDVYVVLVAVDQRFYKNSRAHGILAKLGRDEDASITHFPLPFQLHFELMVHSITNAVAIITNQSQCDAVLYAVHYHAFKHVLLPSDTKYMHGAKQSALHLAVWPHLFFFFFFITSKAYIESI